MDRAAMESYLNKTLPAFAEQIPSLLEAAGDMDSARTLLNKVKPDTLNWRGLKINLDVYEADPKDPVILLHGGIANYARFYYLFLALLSERGFNVIGIDRPGHGFSEGLRGDCTVEDLRELMPEIINYAGKRFNDRIGMMGSSLGGITTFYLLPDLKGLKSAICHNWLYPGESADESKWLLNIILRNLNRFVPGMKIPIRKLVEIGKVHELSESSTLVDYYLNIAADPIYCQSLTLRSVVSYFGGYRPESSYEDVDIPVLGLIPELERVLPFETSQAWWKRAGFPADRLRVIEGAKHMIFHDRCALCLDIVSDWFKDTLS